MSQPQQPEHPPQEGLTRGQWRLIMAAALLLLFAVFVTKNSGEVEVHFVFFKAEIRLIWVFLLCGALGALIHRLLQQRLVASRTELRRRRRG